MSQGEGLPLEAGEGKEQSFPGASRGNTVLQHLGFSPVRHLLEF